MICIFKTPQIQLPSGSTHPKRNAQECQGLCHAKVAICEHDETVQHSKAGRYRLQFETHTYYRGRRATDEEKAAIDRNPDIAILDDVKVVKELVERTLDPVAPEVIISPSCVKENGSPITIDDFPDEWDFGNGVGVNNTARIKGLLINPDDGLPTDGIYAFSYCTFPDSEAANVRAKYKVLRQIMDR